MNGKMGTAVQKYIVTVYCVTEGHCCFCPMLTLCCTDQSLTVSSWERLSCLSCTQTRPSTSQMSSRSLS